jgi:predicted RNA-binding protein YlxR (DUF448 family)
VEPTLAALKDDDADAGPRTTAPGMERLCIVTRAVKPTAELIRFVVGPDGTIVPDLKRKLPGRGVWVTGTRAAVTLAAERKVFGRSFKRDVRIAPNLAELVERLLERSALDALAIAHKAGHIASGFSKVEAALAAEPVVALLHASDASADGVRKLAAAVTRRFGDAESRPAEIKLFTSAQLDLALGRANVVHAAVLAGPASDGFLVRCRSLDRFRCEDGSVRERAARRHGEPAGEQNS